VINSEQKRKLIADYSGSLDERLIVARSVTGLLIIVLIAVTGATSTEETHDGSAKADAAQSRAKATNAELSAKRVATDR
jgi:hypothetical protein